MYLLGNYNIDLLKVGKVQYFADILSFDKSTD